MRTISVVGEDLRARRLPVGALLGSMATVELLSGVTQGYLTPLLPSLGDSLQITASGQTRIYLLSQLAFAIWTPLLAKLGESFGYRRFLRLSIALVAAGSLIMAISPSVLTISVGVVLQGAVVGFMPLLIGILRPGAGESPHRSRPIGRRPHRGGRHRRCRLGLAQRAVGDTRAVGRGTGRGPGGDRRLPHPRWCSTVGRPHSDPVLRPALARSRRRGGRAVARCGLGMDIRRNDRIDVSGCRRSRRMDRRRLGLEVSGGGSPHARPPACGCRLRGHLLSGLLDDRLLRCERGLSRVLTDDSGFGLSYGPRSIALVALALNVFALASSLSTATMLRRLGERQTLALWAP